MDSTTLYGLFPNGWEQESKRVPKYIVNESGNQLRDRLARAFESNDVAAMKEFCVHATQAEHSAFQPRGSTPRADGCKAGSSTR